MMFFKKDPKSVTNVARLMGVTTVEEIHETFLTEVDRLLAEAQIQREDVTLNKDVIDKAKRLQKLGFNNAADTEAGRAEAMRDESLRHENHEKQKLIEAIHYFSAKYPYKFITEESVKRICQQYGLIYGSVEHYKGNVPDKNLEMMENFSIAKEDKVYAHSTHYSMIHSPIIRNVSYKVAEEVMSKRPDSTYIPYDSITDVPLEICAPPKDFNTTNMNLKDFKLEKKMHVPDPIVLQPVLFKDKKYYLIVTAWGDEASDPSVTNEKMN